MHWASNAKRDFAKGQRRSMGRAEALLWTILRAGRLDGWKFKRQVPYGDYVADFSCHAARLIVELDGEPHQAAVQRSHDARRDAWFRAQGFTVLRFPNEMMIMDTDRVVRSIRACLDASAPPSPGRHPATTLSLEGRG